MDLYSGGAFYPFSRVYIKAVAEVLYDDLPTTTPVDGSGALFSNKCARLFKTNRVVLHIHAGEQVEELVATMDDGATASALGLGLGQV